VQLHDRVAAFVAQLDIELGARDCEGAHLVSSRSAVV
jgi:hypothetical protein